MLLKIKIVNLNSEPRRGTFVANRQVRGWFLLVSGVVLLAGVLGGMVAGCPSVPTGAGTKVLGLDKVIAFTYSPSKGFDSKQLHSVTLVGPAKPEDWQYWRTRGVVMGVGHGWYDLLRSPIEKAVDNLVDDNYGGNPRPVVMIDEFGFDYGGRMDEKAARILRLAKHRKPELAFAVWEMRGPIPKVLAEAYRDVADLVMMENYVGGKGQYWSIAAQVWAARRYGIPLESDRGSGGWEGRQSRRGLGPDAGRARTANPLRALDCARITRSGVFRRHPRTADPRRRPVRALLRLSH